MQKREKDITLFVRKASKDHTFSIFPHEYRNLMKLLNDKLSIDDFGECRGVGRCVTCIIKVDSTDIQMAEPERNEQTTLDRCHVTTTGLRLACQILLDTSLDGLRLEVMDGDAHLKPTTLH
jgi:2Fe-2S ferredoxin